MMVTPSPTTKKKKIKKIDKISRIVGDRRIEGEEKYEFHCGRL